MKFVQSGKLDGPTVVLVHGWPDTPLVWQHQLKALESTHRCVCLVLPGYDDADKNFPFFGIPYLDLAKDIAETIKTQIMVDRPEHDDKPFLIAHDWGAAVGYQVCTAHPDLFKKTIFLDVGQTVDPMSLKATLIVLGYHWVNAFAFLLPRPLGTPLVRSMGKLHNAPDLPAVHSRMAWIYFQFWKCLLSGKVPLDWAPPSSPTLFLYGTKAWPCKIYSQKFLDHLDNTPGSGSMAFPGDHWFYVRKNVRDDVNTQIVKFLTSACPRRK